MSSSPQKIKHGSKGCPNHKVKVNHTHVNFPNTTSPEKINQKRQISSRKIYFLRRIGVVSQSNCRISLIFDDYALVYPIYVTKIMEKLKKYY